MPASQRYLGIDPGLTATGWGVIGIEGSKLKQIANGTIAVTYTPLTLPSI